MNTYFKVVQRWSGKDEITLVPEHSVKIICEGTDEYKRPCVRIHIIGGGTYTVYSSLENFIDSNRVEL